MRVPLKVAMIRSGKTQGALSIPMAIPETRLSHIVRGRVNPRDDEKAAIARVLNVPIDQLFEEVGEESLAG